MNKKRYYFHYLNTKKILFTYVNICLLFTSCFSPKRECADYKVGKFEYEAEINGKKEKTFFIRLDSIEVDYFKGKADTSAIRWINNCEYVATKLRPKNNQEKKPVHIKIISTDSLGYTFEFSVVGNAKNKVRGYARSVD